jgi:hypothetical protein
MFIKILLLLIFLILFFMPDCCIVNLPLVMKDGSTPTPLIIFTSTPTKTPEIIATATEIPMPTITLVPITPTRTPNG